MEAAETHVIMPVLGMSQDTGKILRWLKAEGQWVAQGEPLIEVETDKAVVEIEAPASGVLSHVIGQEGDEVPVAQVIAVIRAGEPASEPAAPHPGRLPVSPASAVSNSPPGKPVRGVPLNISPVAARIAAEHHLDLNTIGPRERRIEKADVLAYLAVMNSPSAGTQATRKIPASPKARRLAVEHRVELTASTGSGPGGAILAADVLRTAASSESGKTVPAPAEAQAEPAPTGSLAPVNAAWRLMAERTTSAWTSIPHFFLLREVDASRLLAWHERAQKGSAEKITPSKTTASKTTITDLLVLLSAAALRRHPRVNAVYEEAGPRLLDEIGIGVAVATEEALVVPVIHRADELSLREIAAVRADLVTRARDNRLRLDDLRGGTFTISNLGMYGVDAFNAILNAPQAAILAVGRIAERVVPVNRQPEIRPVMILSASFDHRVVDGARGAQFLQTLADWIEEPLGLLS